MLARQRLLRRALSQEEIQVLQELKRNSERKLTWKTISNIMKTRCKRRITPSQLIREWQALVVQRDPDRHEIIVFFRVLIRVGLFNFQKAADMIQSGPFSNASFCRQFLKNAYIETVIYLKNTHFYYQQGQQMTYQQELIGDLLTKSCDRIRLMQHPQILQYFLLSAYFRKLNYRELKINDLRTVCAYVKQFEKGFFCPRVQVQGCGAWTFIWTENEVKLLYKWYCQFGSHYRLISQNFINLYGEKEKYNYMIIRSKLGRLQREAVEKLQKNTQGTLLTNYKKNMDPKEQDEYQVNYRKLFYIINNENGRKLVVQKAHKHFEQAKKLLGIAMGEPIESASVSGLIQFIGERALSMKYNNDFDEVEQV